MTSSTVGKLSLLAALPATVRAEIERMFTPVRCAAGHELFREGETVDRVYFVVSGDVSLEMNVPGRGRQSVLSLGPGDLLGWSPLFSDTTMTASAVAISTVELLAASGTDLRRLCEADHAVGFFFMRQVAQAVSKRLVATRLQLLDLFAGETVFDSEATD